MNKISSEINENIRSDEGQNKSRMTNTSTENVNTRNIILVETDSTVSMSNEYVSVEFNKNNGHANYLKKNGQNLVGNLVDNQGSPIKETFVWDIYPGGTAMTDVQIISNTLREAHIAFIYDPEQELADTKINKFYMECHTLLRAGDSGFYTYIITKNNTDDDSVNIPEMRMLYRFDKNILDTAYNPERQGWQPSYAELNNASLWQNVGDETWIHLVEDVYFPKGAYYTKYDYCAFISEIRIMGQFGNGYGAFLIPVSDEYYSGGPLRQDLTIHQDALILNYMGSSHMGASGIDMKAHTEKVYGPWYLYLNTGDEKELVEDALAKESMEKTKWPYDFVTGLDNNPNPMYQVSRGIVSGDLKIVDGRSAAGAMVILAGPDGEVLRQNAGYIFHDYADINGHFKILNVRYGEYSLYAYAMQGTVTEQLQLDGIIVKGDVNLGNVEWACSTDNNYLWQIGRSNRSTKGFHLSGSSGTLRDRSLQDLVRKNLIFTIGESCPCTDWDYAQFEGDWDIKFNSTKIYSDEAVVRIAFAAASQSPKITVSLNGQCIGNISIDGNDQSIYRSANRSGRYYLFPIIFDAGNIIVGENILRFHVISGMIMYDTVILATNESGDKDSLKNLVASEHASQYITDNQALQINTYLRDVADFDDNMLNGFKNLLDFLDVPEDSAEIMAITASGLMARRK